MENYVNSTQESGHLLDGKLFNLSNFNGRLVMNYTSSWKILKELTNDASEMRNHLKIYDWGMFVIISIIPLHEAVSERICSISKQKSNAVRMSR